MVTWPGLAYSGMVILPWVFVAIWEVFDAPVEKENPESSHKLDERRFFFSEDTSCKLQMRY